jgi:hypothetical protein
MEKRRQLTFLMEYLFGANIPSPDFFSLLFFLREA